MSSRSVVLLGLTCVALCGAPAAYAQAVNAAPLTRDDAIARALSNDPGVRTADVARAAAEAHVRQAARWPNPTLDFQSENIEGSGPYRSFERAETTYSLSQRLQLGGDRGARRTLAEHDLDAAGAGVRIKQLDLIAEVESAYIDAQAAEAAWRVAEERLRVAEELAAAVRRRVAMARDPLMAGSRAEARLAEIRIETEAAGRNAVEARARLASYWAESSAFVLDMAEFERFAADRANDGDGDLRGRLASPENQARVAWWLRTRDQEPE